jgi:hypothetical protein
MIDAKVWEHRMTFLKAWFNTELIEIEEAFILKCLTNAGLTTEEFEIAVHDIAYNTSKKYKGNFPCAKDFVDAARGDQKARALKLWSRLLANVRESKSKANEFERNSSQVIKDAIAAIGGIQTIDATPDQDLKWLKKDFIEALLAFKALETRQNYLPSSPNKPQLPNSDDN